MQSLHLLNLKVQKIKWDTLFAFVMWHIWLVRNENVYTHKRTKTTAKIPTNLALEYISLTSKGARGDRPKPSFVCWKPPYIGFKLNTNGSANPSSGNGGIGGVIRNICDEWIAGFMGNIRAITNIKAELLALLAGLKLAKE